MPDSEEIRNESAESEDGAPSVLMSAPVASQPSQPLPSYAKRADSLGEDFASAPNRHRRSAGLPKNSVHSRAKAGSGGGMVDIAGLDVVYVLKGKDVDVVKIGHSNRLSTRFHDIQRSSPIPLCVLGAMPGGEKEERRLHKRFAHLRLWGEWFRLDGELRSFVESMPGGVTASARYVVLGKEQRLDALMDVFMAPIRRRNRLRLELFRALGVAPLLPAPTTPEAANG